MYILKCQYRTFMYRQNILYIYVLGCQYRGHIYIDKINNSKYLENYD